MNLLLVTLDTVRADHLGAFGRSPSPTPALDALAARAVVFEDTTTTAPLTLPAHVSLLSGLETAASGVRGNHDRVPATLPLVVDVLAARGYATGAFVSGRPLVASVGLGARFDRYDDRLPDALAGARAPAERRAAGTVAEALRWTAGAEGPWFAWVHLYDAHEPWTPTTGGGYDAELADLDRAVATLLAGVGPDTAVVVVADHGEALGDHGERTHGVFLYQETVRVPLLVAVPGVAPRRVREPVSVIDVAPTLLRLAGAPEDLPGVDLLGPLPAGRTFVAETTFPAERYGWAPLRAVRRGSLKAVEAPDDELYDLAADPREAADLSSARATETAALLRALPPAAARSVQRDEDEAQRAALAALGYVDGPVSEVVDPPDPKSRAALLGPLEEVQEAVFAGDHARAARLLGPIVAADPTNPAALNDLGLANQALGRHDLAFDALSRAVVLAPSDPAVWSNLAVSAGRLGRLDEARRATDEAARLAPDNPAPCVNRAVLELRAGDREAARRWAEEALRREPGLQVALDVLAAAR